MNVLIIPEDFRNDQHILKPLFRRLFRAIGKPHASPHFSRVVCYSAGSIRQCCVPLRRAPRRTVKYASGAFRARALL